MNKIEHLKKFRQSLADGFEMRSMTLEEFQPLWEKASLRVFKDKARLNVQSILTETEKNSMAELGKFMGSPLCLPFGVFQGEQFVGWHVGDQKSREEFYMRNSGVLPEFQGKGLYTALLKNIVKVIGQMGFQVISSKHNATNNRVIVPKLKAGFTITGLEISDKFGTLVRLEYFTNQIRRDVVDFRCGEAMPSKELKPLLGL